MALQLYNERIFICSHDPFAYTKVLQFIWEFEDQGYFRSSSLINGLALSSLFEACKESYSKSAAILAVQSMFIRATVQNKKILVGTVLSVSCGINAYSHENLELWEKGIVESIGTSAMRMDVVESVLIEQCTNYLFITGNNKHTIILCLKSMFSLKHFDSRNLREAIFGRISASEGNVAIAFVRLFQAVAEVDNLQILSYIRLLITLLKDTRRVPKLDLQCAIYDAIDILKQQASDNVYQETFFQVFPDAERECCT
ncbi:hypothetical protein O6H91_02G123200 [Diphasiastrum complanatum]|uniref:Uncharacterized protein n=3 Tax=Diphasiastrum complanatum TaxID=34168 RepID=A0ACC2EK94_DIPCM|nr:hypothetical protein O6H91_02G123200 [Diphasiastrum complanatum]KAJ7566887.1 hypothetical protein O6H91_02G123200 [Diphasiastrum complanatum]